MPVKVRSQQTFTLLASSPSIDTNLTCQGSENRTSHPDITEISEASLREGMDAATPHTPFVLVLIWEV